MSKLRNYNQHLFTLALLLFGLTLDAFGQPTPLDTEHPPSLEESRGGGIEEVIPEKYKKRYQEWKTEFLSTETGREQWARYAHDTHLMLTITVSSNNRNGGKTSQFKWDNSGQLRTATITLGSRIDQSYPQPIFYPVLNALEQRNPSEMSRKILAAAKIAHEFGHVNRIAMTNIALYQRQTQLIPIYNSILLSNGHNTYDLRLIDLAQQMGGTPVEIWEDDESWGEANVMLYLGDKITNRAIPCSLFSKIKQNVESYAKSYADRFMQTVKSQSSFYRCSQQSLTRLITKR
jgi:hypothetical protein